MLLAIVLALAGCSDDGEAAARSHHRDRAVVSDLVGALDRGTGRQPALLSMRANSHCSPRWRRGSGRGLGDGGGGGARRPGGVWSSFVESLDTFSGRKLSKGEVSDPDRFRVGSVRFAAVPFRLREKGKPRLGAAQWPRWWKVDLLATFGGRFATPLHDWLVADEGSAEVAKSDVRCNATAAASRRLPNTVAPGATHPPKAKRCGGCWDIWPGSRRGRQTGLWVVGSGMGLRTQNPLLRARKP